MQMGTIHKKNGNNTCDALMDKVVKQLSQKFRERDSGEGVAFSTGT